MLKDDLIDTIISLSGKLPKPDRYRRYLEGQTLRALAQKITDLEATSRRLAQNSISTRRGRESKTPELGRNNRSWRDLTGGAPTTASARSLDVGSSMLNVECSGPPPWPSDPITAATLPPGSIAAITDARGKTKWIKSSNKFPAGQPRRGYQ